MINALNPPLAKMIRLLAVFGVFAAISAFAQAPTEERMSPGENRVVKGQQRLEFLRREAGATQEAVKRAELEFIDAQNRENAVQKQLDAARKRREAAGVDLDRARRQSALVSKAYESESAEFERNLKGGKAKDGKVKNSRDDATRK
jgi:hypothetical protein